MKTFYEVMNIDLAQEYTKARKLEKLSKLVIGDAQVEIAAKTAIEAMDIPEDDDRHHWIQKIGRAMGADLLTIGKVQPENMLAAAALSTEDFKEAVKVATSAARKLNEQTIAAEKELNEETIPSTMV